MKLTVAEAHKIIEGSQLVANLKEQIKQLEKELAEQRENAIVPKFKYQQEVWYQDVDDDDTIKSFSIAGTLFFGDRNNNFQYYLANSRGYFLEDMYGQDALIDESHIFATEAEAQASLEKGE